MESYVIVHRHHSIIVGPLLIFKSRRIREQAEHTYRDDLRSQQHLHQCVSILGKSLSRTNTSCFVIPGADAAC